MADSAGLGFMAAFVVSGSVILIARQIHKRLISEFMEQIESELIGSKKYQTKKMVRFAENIIEPSSNNEEYRKKHMVKSLQCHYHHRHGDHVETLENMPVNRQIMYKAIIKARCLKGYNV